MVGMSFAKSRRLQSFKLLESSIVDWSPEAINDLYQLSDFSGAVFSEIVIVPYGAIKDNHHRSLH